MSASPYKLPPGFLRVAGQQLGIDLEELLNPDPTTGKSILEGFDPVLSLGPQPYGTKKPRGNVLGYKQPSMPSAGNFTLVPKTGGGTTGGGTTGGGTTRAPLSTKYGNSPTIFGTQDYDVAKSLGYDDASIKKYLEEGKLTLGDDIAKQFNLPNQSWDYKAPGFTSPAAGAATGGTAPSRGALSTRFGNDPNIFGTQDYEVGKLLNYSDPEIEDYVKKGSFQLGDDLAKKFNLPSRSWDYKAPASAPAATPAAASTPAPTPTPTPTQPSFTKSVTSFDLSKDSQGRSNVQESSSDYFGTPRGILSTKYGNDPGIFGTKDLAEAKAMNFADEEIAKWLYDKNIPVGDDIPDALGSENKPRLAGQIYKNYKLNGVQYA